MVWLGARARSICATPVEDRDAPEAAIDSDRRRRRVGPRGDSARGRIRRRAIVDLIGRATRILAVLITAQPDEGFRASAQQSGIVGYLTKPLDECDLLGWIRPALARGKQGRQGS